jgi:hypothetical protein
VLPSCIVGRYMHPAFMLHSYALTLQRAHYNSTHIHTAFILHSYCTHIATCTAIGFARTAPRHHSYCLRTESFLISFLGSHSSLFLFGAVTGGIRFQNPCQPHTVFWRASASWTTPSVRPAWSALPPASAQNKVSTSRTLTPCKHRTHANLV